MRGVHVLADLVAQDLHGKAGFVAVEDGAVDEQASRFVDGDQVFVPIQDGESFFHVMTVMGRAIA